MMCEKPILFSTPMVQAILEGRKTMTRRVTKAIPPYSEPFYVDAIKGEYGLTNFDMDGNILSQSGPYKLPYKTGDRLYVKENAWIWCKKVRDGWTLTGKPKYRYIPVGQHVVYQADHPGKPEYRIDDNPEHDWRMKVARFMPHWASRITLDVVSRRVERVQEITEEDARAEGAVRAYPTTEGYYLESEYATYRGGFSALWDSINAKRGYGWNTNPWVWVIGFKRAEGGAE